MEKGWRIMNSLAFCESLQALKFSKRRYDLREHSMYCYIPLSSQENYLKPSRQEAVNAVEYYIGRVYQ